MEQVNSLSVLVNGVDLTYVEQGSGEPLIFVHGSLSDYRTWLLQLAQFSQNFRAISYSRRYHYPNATTGNETDYTVSLHAHDLIAFIEALHLGSVKIVGTSFGAYTTLVAAILRPDLMRKLVICEPPILPWLLMIPGGQEYWDNFMSSAWIPARQEFQNGNLERGVRLFVDGISGSGAYERVPDANKRRMLDNASSLKAEALSPDYFTEITAEQVRQISLPMLLVKGEKSLKMFHLIVDRLAQSARNARQATIPNASHSIAATNPQAFRQVAYEFLQEG